MIAGERGEVNGRFYLMGNPARILGLCFTFFLVGGMERPMLVEVVRVLELALGSPQEHTQFKYMLVMVGLW